MTDAELELMEGMWRDGLALKQIAHRLGYTLEYVGHVMRHDRARYPLRRRKFDSSERDAWAGRVLSGELTCKQAAGLAGCSESAVRRWARARRAES